MRIRYAFLDVAGTLLHKPGVAVAFQAALAARGVEVEVATIERAHKLTSEERDFPAKTTLEFYRGFNAAVLRALGTDADDALTEDVAARCAGIAWEPFEDVGSLADLGVPLGIVSNWDRRLTDRLAEFVALPLDRVLGSADEGVAKPDVRLYERAAAGLELAPDEILYVGDSIRLDIEPAASLGWRAVLIDRLGLYDAHEGPRVTTLRDLPALMG